MRTWAILSLIIAAAVALAPVGDAVEGPRRYDVTSDLHKGLNPLDARRVHMLVADPRIDTKFDSCIKDSYTRLPRPTFLAVGGSVDGGSVKLAPAVREEELASPGGGVDASDPTDLLVAEGAADARRADGGWKSWLRGVRSERLRKIARMKRRVGRYKRLAANMVRRAAKQKRLALKARSEREVSQYRMRLALAKVYRTRAMVEETRAQRLHRYLKSQISFEDKGKRSRCVRQAVRRIRRKYRSRAFRRCLMMNPTTSFLQVDAGASAGAARGMDLAIRERAAKLRAKIRAGKLPPTSTIAHYAMMDATHVRRCLRMGRAIHLRRIAQGRKRRPPTPMEKLRRYHTKTRDAAHVFGRRVRKQVDKQFASFARTFMHDYMRAGSHARLDGGRVPEFRDQWDKDHAPAGMPRETRGDVEPGLSEEQPPGTVNGGIITNYLDGKDHSKFTDESLAKSR